MASLPAPIRAGLGLLATALDTVQELVERAPEIPMEAVGNSMQLSMRLQQQYVALLTRGDEFIASLRGAPAEAPAWATFDDDLPSTAAPDSGSGTGDDAVVDDLPAAEREDEPRSAGQGDPLLDAVTSARRTAGPAPTKAAPTKAAASKSATQAAAKKAGARKAPAKPVGVSAVEGTLTASEMARKAPAKKAGAKRLQGRAAAELANPRTDDSGAEPALVSAGPALTPAPAAKKAPAKKAAASPIGSPGRAAKVASTAKAPANKVAHKAAGRAVPADTRNAPDLVVPAGGPTVAGGAVVDDATPMSTSAAIRPQLDAALDNGDARARPLSAFDRAETQADDSPTDGLSGDAPIPDTLSGDAVLSDAEPADAVLADAVPADAVSGDAISGDAVSADASSGAALAAADLAADGVDGAGSPGLA